MDHSRPWFDAIIRFTMDAMLVFRLKKTEKKQKCL